MRVAVLNALPGVCLVRAGAAQASIQPALLTELRERRYITLISFGEEGAAVSALPEIHLPDTSGFAPAPGFRYHVELINGEEVEKPMPKNLHAFIQRYLLLALTKLLPEDYVALPELDVLTGGRTSDGRREYICPDVQVVLRDTSYIDGMLAEPPLLGVEIMSPGQRLTQLFTRAERLLAINCPSVWVIWPEQRRAWEYMADDLQECSNSLKGQLPGGGLIHIPLTDLWATLD